MSQRRALITGITNQDATLLVELASANARYRSAGIAQHP
jgi:hypothetical protein